MSSASLATATASLETLRRAAVETYLKTARTLWRGLLPADWWNDAVTVATAARLTLIELEMIAQVRRAAVSYADASLRLAGYTPKGQNDRLVYPRDNTDPWTVQQRPADTYRHKAAGHPSIRPERWPDKDDDYYRTVQQWIKDSFDRLPAVAEMDATAAMNQAVSDRFLSSGVKQYRRVIHPELSRTGTCGLCVAASTRVYRMRDLLPLHGGCNCTISPIGAKDPGLDLTADDLRALYRKAGGTSAARLRRTRYRVERHGELGPTLVPADSTPSRAAPTYHRPDAATTRRQTQRMLDHADTFAAAYRQVARTGEEYAFRLDGKSYRFKPTPKLKQAQAWQESLARQLRSRL